MFWVPPRKCVCKLTHVLTDRPNLIAAQSDCLRRNSFKRTSPSQLSASRWLPVRTLCHHPGDWPLPARLDEKGRGGSGHVRLSGPHRALFWPGTCSYRGAHPSCGTSVRSFDQEEGVQNRLDIRRAERTWRTDGDSPDNKPHDLPQPSTNYPHVVAPHLELLCENQGVPRGGNAPRQDERESRGTDTSRCQPHGDKVNVNTSSSRRCPARVCKQPISNRHTQG